MMTKKTTTKTKTVCQLQNKYDKTTSFLKFTMSIFWSTKFSCLYNFIITNLINLNNFSHNYFLLIIFVQIYQHYKTPISALELGEVGCHILSFRLKLLKMKTWRKQATIVSISNRWSSWSSTTTIGRLQAKCPTPSSSSWWTSTMSGPTLSGRSTWRTAPTCPSLKVNDGPLQWD